MLSSVTTSFEPLVRQLTSGLLDQSGQTPREAPASDTQDNAPAPVTESGQSGSGAQAGAGSGGETGQPPAQANAESRVTAQAASEETPASPASDTGPARAETASSSANASPTVETTGAAPVADSDGAKAASEVAPIEESDRLRELRAALVVVTEVADNWGKSPTLLSDAIDAAKEREEDSARLADEEAIKTQNASEAYQTTQRETAGAPEPGTSLNHAA